VNTTKQPSHHLGGNRLSNHHVYQITILQNTASEYFGVLYGVNSTYKLGVCLESCALQVGFSFRFFTLSCLTDQMLAVIRSGRKFQYDGLAGVCFDML